MRYIETREVDMPHAVRFHDLSFWIVMIIVVKTRYTCSTSPYTHPLFDQARIAAASYFCLQLDTDQVGNYYMK